MEVATSLLAASCCVPTLNTITGHVSHWLAKRRTLDLHKRLNGSTCQICLYCKVCNIFKWKTDAITSWFINAFGFAIKHLVSDWSVMGNEKKRKTDYKILSSKSVILGCINKTVKVKSKGSNLSIRAVCYTTRIHISVPSIDPDPLTLWTFNIYVNGQKANSWTNVWPAEKPYPHLQCNTWLCLCSGVSPSGLFYSETQQQCWSS